MSLRRLRSCWEVIRREIPPPRVVFGIQHAIASGQRDIGGQRRALGAALFLHDLDEQNLAALDDFLDLVVAHRLEAAAPGLFFFLVLGIVAADGFDLDRGRRVLVLGGILIVPRRLLAAGGGDVRAAFTSHCRRIVGRTRLGGDDTRGIDRQGRGRRRLARSGFMIGRRPGGRFGRHGERGGRLHLRCRWRHADRGLVAAGGRLAMRI